MEVCRQDDQGNWSTEVLGKDDKLHLTVFARSIDLVFGFCNDQYTFAKLMEHVSKKTGYAVGEMHWFITNLHIYPRHYELFANNKSN